MKRLFCFVLLSLMASIFSVSHASQSPEANSPSQAQLNTILAELPKTKLSKMANAVDALANLDHPKVRNVLTYLLESELYYQKSDKSLVRAVKNSDGQYQLSNLISDQAISVVSKSAIKKIRTNNSIRKKIRGALARIDLTHPDEATRIAAVKRILNKPDNETIELLKDLVEKEQSTEVIELMTTAIALKQLSSDEISEKLQAIDILKSSLEPAVKNALQRQLTAVTEDEAQSTEQGDIALIKSLTSAIEKIEQKRSTYEVVENVFFGLSLGSVLLLAAIGLAITFGVMGVINMAHGEMIMLGAYTTYVIQQAFPELLNYSLLMAIPAAFLVSGFVGILIERGVIRYLKGRPLETLLATFGISLILQQLVRSVFSPLNRTVASPEWMSGSWQINPVFSLTYNRLYIIIFALMVFVTLLMILKKTSLGLHVRAVSQNREMARALSIKSDWVDAITFGIGSGIAGVAGVALSQLTNVGPNLGQSYIIDSFLVVVFGGVGNLWGTLVAAMSLGTVNKFLEPITGSVLASIIVLVGLVLFIQKRPKGLFPQKGRAAD
ncbi:urea ABC transporter permease subunit UrtB [Saccharobesus litoralis]|uniref:Urea ABC transporter permease subunit UrtB n=1 Tax=Saccharobesus litoralis TaxID=2172099 RepID=A0A2S0VWS9_9ALTE|nr:urea ABC transporter permease subunit UrtB [Saccharobesus litoralis]AWB68671.1 urea ABC transporter permease subunit UrtB [Saccharobesus litoralis]